eukprot:scaffold323833_cov36-Tisochrysis_lutea.AAC.1
MATQSTSSTCGAALSARPGTVQSPSTAPTTSTLQTTWPSGSWVGRDAWLVLLSFWCAELLTVASAALLYSVGWAL